MGLEKELGNFLEHNFGVNDFIRPLFYNFPIGIRFEIGVGSPKTKEYKHLGNFRVNEIFNSLFKENDRILFVVDRYETGEKDYYRNSIKRVNSLMRECSDNVCYELRHIIDNEEVNLKRYIYKTKVSDLNIKNLIKIIIKDDFKKFRNKMNSVVYIINLDWEIIYFLYDDRGLDIIAKRLNSIEQIYNKYNEWILAYDRKKTDALFINFNENAKKRLDEAINEYEIIPVSMGYIDLITRKEMIVPFVNVLNDIGIRIFGFTWWCFVDKSNASCPHGMGGPKNIYGDSWFSEISMFDTKEFPPLESVIDNNKKYVDYILSVYPNQEDFHECYTPGFYLDVPKIWKNRYEY